MELGKSGHGVFKRSYFLEGYLSSQVDLQCGIAGEEHGGRMSMHWTEINR